MAEGGRDEPGARPCLSDPQGDLAPSSETPPDRASPSSARSIPPKSNAKPDALGSVPINRSGLNPHAPPSGFLHASRTRRFRRSKKVRLRCSSFEHRRARIEPTRWRRPAAPPFRMPIAMARCARTASRLGAWTRDEGRRRRESRGRTRRRL